MSKREETKSRGGATNPTDTETLGDRTGEVSTNLGEQLSAFSRQADAFEQYTTGAIDGLKTRIEELEHNVVTLSELLNTSVQQTDRLAKIVEERTLMAGGEEPRSEASERRMKDIEAAIQNNAEARKTLKERVKRLEEKVGV